MESYEVRWYHVVLGTALMGAAMAAGWHVIVRGVEQTTVAMVCIGIVFLVGLWTVIPYRARAITGELRDWIEWWRGGNRSDE